MAVLPGPEALGSLPDNTPRHAGVGRWNPNAISEAASALGRGFENLGNSVVNVAVEQEKRTDELQVAQAKGATIAATTGALANISKLTDPDQIQAARQNLDETLQTNAATITNPRSRQMFLAGMMPHMAAVGADYTKHGITLDNQTQLATFDQSSNVIIKNTTSGEDEDKAREGIDAINGTIGAMIRNGVIDPVEGEKLRLGKVEQWVTSRHDFLVGEIERKGAETGVYDVSPLIKFQQANELTRSAKIPAVSGGAVQRIAGYRQPMEAAAGEYGVSPDYLAKTMFIESQGLAGADNGFARGIMQFSKGTAAAYGVNPSDPASSIRGAAHYAADNKAVLSAALGRDPTDAELYLAHQQDGKGAAALLTHPDTPAGQLVNPKAIIANGGDPYAPARQFTEMWAGKYAAAPSLMGDGAPSPFVGLPRSPSAPSAVTSAPKPDASNSFFIGDSIAEGLKGAAKASGDTAVGRSPERVLDAINDADPEELKGKTIYLSTGASNAPDATTMVHAQLDALKEKGVDLANVRVIGVGDRKDFVDEKVNDKLAAIAKAEGAAFAGPLDMSNLAGDRVHAADYGKALTAIAGLNDINNGVSGAPGAGGGNTMFGALPPARLAEVQSKVGEEIKRFQERQLAGDNPVVQKALVGLEQSSLDAAKKAADAENEADSVAAVAPVLTQIDDLVARKIILPTKAQEAKGSLAVQVAAARHSAIMEKIKREGYAAGTYDSSALAKFRETLNSPPEGSVLAFLPAAKRAEERQIIEADIEHLATLQSPKKTLANKQALADFDQEANVTLKQSATEPDEAKSRAMMEPLFAKIGDMQKQEILDPVEARKMRAWLAETHQNARHDYLVDQIKRAGDAPGGKYDTSPLERFRSTSELPGSAAVDPSRYPMLPPKSEHPANTAYVAANHNGTFDYVTAGGERTPVPGIRPSGSPGAWRPTEGSGSVIDALPAQKQAEMHLKIDSEIEGFQRAQQARDKLANEQTTTDMKVAGDNLTAGRPVPPNAVENLRARVEKSRDPKMGAEFAKFNAGYNTVQGLVGKSPAEVAYQVNNMEADYTRAYSADPFGSETVLKGAALDAAKDFQKQFDGDIKTQALTRASTDGTLPKGWLKPLDASSPTAAADFIQRAAAVKVVSEKYGVDVPMFQKDEGAAFAESLAKTPAVLSSFASPALVAQMADDTGFRTKISGMSRSADPTKMNAAFNAMNAVSVADPMKFDTRFSEDSRNMQLWQRLVSNMPPELAAKRMEAVSDPKLVAMRKYTEEEANKELASITTDKVISRFAQFRYFNPMTWYPGSTPGAPASDVDTPMSSATALRADWASAFRDYYVLDPSREQASQAADQVIAKKWGPSPANGNKIMPYPPESRYPDVNGKWDYIKDQLDEAVRKQIGEADIDPAAVGGESAAMMELEGKARGHALVSDSQTKADIDAGLLPSYGVVVQHANGSYALLEKSPGVAFRFFAVPDGPAAQAKSAFDAKQAAAAADLTKRRAIESAPPNFGVRPPPSPSGAEAPRVP